MAVWHIKSTGTKSALTASTADDWTDANCFPLEGGTFDIQNVFNALSTGDEIILDDETHLHTGIINLGNGPGAAVTITIKSRSGVATNCIISSDYASNVIFAHNSSTYAHNITYENITFTKSITFTAATGVVTSHSGVTGDATFTGCVFDSITVSSAASNTNGMLTQTTTMAAGTRNITYTDCTFSNLSLTAAERPGITASTTDNLVFINDCVMSDCTLVSTGGDVLGMFYDNGSPIDCDGLTVTNLTLTGDGTNPVNGGVFFQPAAGSTVTARNVNVDTIIITGAEGGCSAPVLHARVSAALYDSSVTNASNTSVGNSVGCLILIGSTGTGTVENCVSHDNTGFYGAGCYNTFSGTVTARNVKSYNNSGGAAGIGFAAGDIEGVDFYSGGSGDATWIGCESYGATVQASAASSSVYAINNTAAGRTLRDKVVTIQNCTFADPVTTTIEPARFSNTNATTNSLTVNITNSIISSDATNDILATDGTASTPCDLTLVKCNYGTIDSTGQTVGTLTETDKITGDPLFVSTTNHELQSTSPCVGVGNRWWTGKEPVGTNGEPFSDIDTDIGGLQSTHGPFHPVNL